MKIVRRKDLLLLPVAYWSQWGKSAKIRFCVWQFKIKILLAVIRWYWAKRDNCRGHFRSKSGFSPGIFFLTTKRIFCYMI